MQLRLDRSMLIRRSHRHYIAIQKVHELFMPICDLTVLILQKWKAFLCCTGHLMGCCLSVSHTCVCNRGFHEKAVSGCPKFCEMGSSSWRNFRVIWLLDSFDFILFKPLLRIASATGGVVRAGWGLLSVWHHNLPKYCLMDWAVSAAFQ